MRESAQELGELAGVVEDAHRAPVPIPAAAAAGREASTGSPACSASVRAIPYPSSDEGSTSASARASHRASASSLTTPAIVTRERSAAEPSTRSAIARACAGSRAPSPTSVSATADAFASAMASRASSTQRDPLARHEAADEEQLDADPTAPRAGNPGQPVGPGCDDVDRQAHAVADQPLAGRGAGGDDVIAGGEGAKLQRARQIAVRSFELPAREMVDEEQTRAPDALEQRTELARAQRVAHDEVGALARGGGDERIDEVYLVAPSPQTFDDEAIVDVPARRLREVAVGDPRDTHGYTARS